MPLSRGIERFTGITQAMVDAAPPAAEVLPELARLMEGRVLVAHNAPFDRRVLRRRSSAPGSTGPTPPVLCTVALSRKLAPLVRRRGLASLADALGIEVEAVHRALPDAETCARVLCALFTRLCAHAATVGDAVELCRSPRRRRAEQAPRPAIPREERPTSPTLPEDPGVYVFRDERGRPLYVGKSVSLRTRARAHFMRPRRLDRARGGRGLQAHQLRAGRAGAGEPADQAVAAARQPGAEAHRQVGYVRCRLDVEYPILEVSPEPASGRALSIGPLRGRKLATELADHLTSLFKLRHCGRALQPARAPLDLRADGPLLLTLPGRPRPQRLPPPDRPGAGAVRAARAPRDALLGEIERRMRDGLRGPALRGRRGAAAPARAARAAARTASGASCAPCTPSRGWCRCRHPVEPRYDAFWVVGGRVADWGPLPGHGRARGAHPQRR